MIVTDYKKIKSIKFKDREWFTEDAENNAIKLYNDILAIQDKIHNLRDEIESLSCELKTLNEKWDRIYPFFEIEYETFEKKEIKNENLVDQYYIRYHHEALVSNEVFERVNTLLDAKKLAGQRNFKGIGSIRELTMLARRDKNLKSIQKYLPYQKGKYTIVTK
jgi:hypothetical protein